MVIRVRLFSVCGTFGLYAMADRAVLMKQLRALIDNRLLIPAIDCSGIGSGEK